MPNENIYFVTSASARGSTAHISSIMKAAFASIKNKKFSPRWIDANKIDTENINSTDIYVLDSFTGDAFDYLKENNAKIISPYVIKYCDEDMISKPFPTIPMRSFPIFSQCMRGLSITCTNLSTEKKSIVENKVLKMSGAYDQSLHSKINFLVSDSVLTMKYKAAIKLRIPVMQCDWVDACWDRYQFEFARADADHIVSKYLLPIFHGLTITVSQIDFDERTKIKEIVNENGGVFSPSLKFNVPNTILLLREQSGDKYKYARLKKIPCLRVEWVYDSLKAKYALPEDDYYIDQQQLDQQTASNNKQTASASTQIDGSNKFKESSTTHFHCSSLPSTSQATISTNFKTISATIKEDTFVSLANKLDELAVEFNDASFLDNCVLYAIGFDRGTLESIKNAARRCGAFFLTQFKSIVTHVIIGPNVDPDDLSYFEENRTDKLVTIDWLIACLQSSDCCSHIPYQYNQEQKTTEIKSNKNNFYSPRKIATQKTSTSKNCSSPAKKNFDLLSENPEEICKRIDQQTTDLSALNTIRNKIHASQNFKSLAEEAEESPVTFSPKVNVPILDIENRNSSSSKHYLSDENDQPRKCSKKGNHDLSNHSYDDSEVEDNQMLNESTEMSTEQDYEDEEENEEEEHSTSSTNIQSNTSKVKSSAAVFMFSGLDADIKDSMMQLVTNKLKVKVRDEAFISEDVTHLILTEPYASEKTLSAISAGIWILKPEYVHDSLKSGLLVAEREYEWGLNWINGSSQLRHKLMVSAIKWRLHINKTHQKVFHDWSVLVINESQMNKSCAQILLSGGAEVFHMDDNRDNELELVQLVKRVRYSMVDIKFQSKPLMSKRKFLEYVSILANRKKIIRNECISRFIIDGPGTSAIEKFLVTEQQVRDALAKVS